MTEERKNGYVIVAKYNKYNNQVNLFMSNVSEISLKIDDIKELKGISPDKLEYIEVSPSGLGLHWPQLDIDLYVPKLLKQLENKKKKSFIKRVKDFFFGPDDFVYRIDNKYGYQPKYPAPSTPPTRSRAPSNPPNQNTGGMK